METIRQHVERYLQAGQWHNIRSLALSAPLVNDPAYARVYAIFAAALRRTAIGPEDRKLAVALLEHALSTGPDDRIVAEIHLTAAAVYLEMYDFARALAHLDSVPDEQLTAWRWHVVYNRGLAFQGLHAWNEAVKAFDTALDCASTPGEANCARLGKWETIIQSGRTAEAHLALLTMSHPGPYEGWWHLLVAEAAIALGESQGAVRYAVGAVWLLTRGGCERGFHNSLLLGRSHLTLLKAHTKLGDDEKALRSWATIVDMSDCPLYIKEEATRWTHGLKGGTEHEAQSAVAGCGPGFH